MQHPLNEKLQGTQIKVCEKMYTIAVVAMDGSLILEPDDVYGGPDSIVVGGA